MYTGLSFEQFFLHVKSLRPYCETKLLNSFKCKLKINVNNVYTFSLTFWNLINNLLTNYYHI